MPHTVRSLARNFLTFAAALLTGALLAVAAPGGAVADSHSASRVTQQSHTIDFGQQITVTLQAENDDADIVDIRAFYRPRGPGNIQSYSYADFTPGRAVTASSSISTGGANYFPPGTEFEVYFEITDSTGMSIQTEPQVIEYLDPGIDWKRQADGPLTVVYYNISDGEIEGLLDAAQEQLPAMARMTGVEEIPDFKAVVFPSVQAATPSFPPVSQTATDNHFFAGFAMARYGLFVQGEPSQSTFVHELSHLLVASVVRSTLATQAPSWLDEGLAVYSETGSRQPTESSVASAAAENRLLPLRNMNRIPGQRDQIAVFYPQSGNFVGYLVEQFGEESMGAMLQNLNAGQRLDDAFAEAFGESMADVENEWRTSVGAQPLPASTPTANNGESTSEPDATPQTQPTATPPAQPPADQPPTPSATISRLLPWAIAAVAVIVVGTVILIRRWRRTRVGTDA
ncbi:MAG: hypothetical protein WD208_03895 [Dehalococcoidia bacterium]